MAALYDELLEKITAPTLTTENWDGILTFCDKINEDPDGCKAGIKSLKKRLNNRDPHVILMAISVLDSAWANCGERFRQEISSAQVINELKALSTNSQRLIAEKMRVTIKKWVDNECKKEPSLSLIVSLYRQLKEDGYSFEAEDSKVKREINSKYANDPNYVSSEQEEEAIAKAIAASLAEAEKEEKIKKSTSLYPTTTNGKSSSTMKSNSVERKVRALYDFEAAEGNELSFVAGDVIIVMDESNPHWWSGRIGVQQGLFPSSFVTSDLEDETQRDKSKEQKAPEVVASINEAILSRCLNVLHECDPTGERADPADLAQLEAASNAQGPLIDAQLANIDKQSNALAQIDIAIRDVLALYDDAIQKSAYPPAQNSYAQQQQQQFQQPQQTAQQYYGYQSAYPQNFPSNSQYSAPPTGMMPQQQYYAPTDGAPAQNATWGVHPQQQQPSQQPY